MRFLLRILISAAALWVAVKLVGGLSYTGSLWGLLGVALVFGIVNATIKPLLFVLTLPALILTLGLFTFVLNAIMLLITSWLSGTLGLGFHVSGFIPALLGSLVVTIVSWGLSLFVSDDDRRKNQVNRESIH